MADSAWIAVAGAVVGGGLTGAVALLQARAQHGFETRRAQHDRDHAETTRRRAELMQIYTRYKVAADRLENAIRPLAEARGDASRLEAFEAAQDEYDRAGELLKLVAARRTAEAASRQRQLFNQLVVQALRGGYDHQASHAAVVETAAPVLDAMRADLGSPD